MENSLTDLQTMKTKKLDGIKYEMENCGQVVCERGRKTKRGKQRQKEGKTERWRKGATDVAGPRAIQVIMV